jgi:hypothetical protein
MTENRLVYPMASSSPKRHLRSDGSSLKGGMEILDGWLEGTR